MLNELYTFEEPVQVVPFSNNKMENSIQNIILQEMEFLEGIMITTTNLTCNLDKATDDSVGGFCFGIGQKCQ